MDCQFALIGFDGYQNVIKLS